MRTHLDDVELKPVSGVGGDQGEDDTVERHVLQHLPAVQRPGEPQLSPRVETDSVIPGYGEGGDGVSVRVVVLSGLHYQGDGLQELLQSGEVGAE